MRTSTHTVAVLHQGMPCPGKKVSALVVALPEIWDHQFSSLLQNIGTVSMNSGSANRKCLIILIKLHLRYFNSSPLLAEWRTPFIICASRCCSISQGHNRCRTLHIASLQDPITCYVTSHSLQLGTCEWRQHCTVKRLPTDTVY